MSNPVKLPTCVGDEPDLIRCIVETPRGSRAKFKWDGEAKLFTLSKTLVAGLTYPYDWGFIPSTVAEDGDPLDVMMLHDVSTYPGMMLCCRLIGMLEVYDCKDGERTPNHRLFAVPSDARRESAIDDVRELPQRLRQELGSFFVSTATLDKKEVAVGEWHGPGRARELLERAMKRYRETR
jgi:inorganic pyrophosphatase